MHTINYFQAPTFRVLSARALAATTIAGLTTFAIFVAMHAMIKQDTRIAQPAKPIVLDNPVFQNEDDKPIERTRVKPMTEPKTPPTAPRDKPDVTTDPSDTTFATPVVEKLATELPKFGMGNGDAELRPVVRVDPRYPNDAARQGIEGWVELRFNVDSTGSVTDIDVVNAEPKRVFDSAARRALSRWKYKPAKRDGRPIGQTGLSVVLEFTLADS